MTNYYEVLGVAQTATLEEIKKRYRQLARQFHPDVNPGDPNAARRFSEVAEAYRVLSDSNGRAVHDLELNRAKLRAEEAKRRAAGPASATRPASATAGAAPRPATAQNVAAAGSESARLVAQAQAALVRNRLVEARSLAEQALRLNRRNAQAYELLGDVFRIQNRVDEAMNMYSMALQINPRNPSVMQRLERMSRVAAAASGGTYRATVRPSVARGSSYTPPSRPAGGYSPGGAGGTGPSRYSPPPRPAAPASGYAAADTPLADKSALLRILGSLFGYGVVFLLVLYVALLGTGQPAYPPTAFPFSLVPHWNATLWVVLALSGLVLGWTMTDTLTIRRIEDELILPGSPSGGGRFLPIGAVLIVLSVLSFYAAALLYLIVQAVQEAVTTSMLRVFGAVTAVTLLLAAVYAPDHLNVLLFGGNVVFLAYLAGWTLGDFFRPDGF